jgi:hypothetical protein
MFWLGLAVGIVIGSVVGIMVMAVCAISGRGDDDGVS